MRRRKRLPSRLLAAAAAAAAACWVGGFVWFLSVTHHLDQAPPPHMDGIVALTGGGGRIETALHMLAHNRADWLLLSGIGGGTDLATLGRLAGIDTAPLANRITLGRYAASTRGNGLETAAWAAQNRIGSLIVVTAAYHMPRAMAELRQALPDIRLFPLPVTSGAAAKGPGFRLEAAEYTKYLLTVSGLSGWLPHRETASQGLATRGSLTQGPDAQGSDAQVATAGDLVSGAPAGPEG